MILAAVEPRLIVAYHRTDGRTLQRISPQDITDALQMGVTALGSTYGLLPKHISARLLWASRAMALLCADIDTNIIRLIGRWHLDEMLT